MTNEAKRNEDTVEPLVRLCYRLRRHLLNPDNIPLPTWARIGCDMLAELRDIDPAKYTETMKPNAPDQARLQPSPEAGCSPVWVQPPDCPRCGQPLKPIKHTHGQWTCGNHADDGKCLWFDWELTMILRARLDQANGKDQARL